MTRSLPFRRCAVALAAFAVMGLVGSLPAAQAGSFKTSGIYTFTDLKGGETAGTLVGQSAPGGRFTGSFTQHNHAGGFAGEVTFNYGGGALTFEYQMEFDDESGLFVGSYEITGGTGNLEGASGGGTLWVEPGGGDASGGFWMEGTLDR